MTVVDYLVMYGTGAIALVLTLVSLDGGYRLGNWSFWLIPSVSALAVITTAIVLRHTLGHDPVWWWWPGEALAVILLGWWLYRFVTWQGPIYDRHAPKDSTVEEADAQEP